MQILEEQLHAEVAERGIGKIPVGISSCLLGERVRYDGGHKANSYVAETLSNYFEFRKFCPELDIGLGVPRKPIRLTRKNSGRIHCISVDDSGRDYTEALTQCADAQQHWHEKLCAYILKSDSPSCGMQGVKICVDTMSIPEGVGVYAAKMMENFPWLPVEEEGRLGDAILRDNFIQRVIVMRRWHQLNERAFNVAGLLEFHARHKLIVMRHDQLSYHRLSELVAATSKDKLQQNASIYLLQLMQALKISVTTD
ncbi:MAG: DUF1722 domain-containing protein [Pseudohongiella sp.]|nr:DUF1722 domain-containing protein [Pseudohongiella sp.]